MSRHPLRRLASSWSSFSGACRPVDPGTRPGSRRLKIDRDAFQRHLDENGIETLIHYPLPAHRQKALLQWNGLSFPVTEKMHREVLSLPVSPVMTLEQAEYVVKIINQY